MTKKTNRVGVGLSSGPAAESLTIFFRVDIDWASLAPRRQSPFGFGNGLNGLGL
jgi:hypothetical protein